MIVVLFDQTSDGVNIGLRVGHCAMYSTLSAVQSTGVALYYIANDFFRILLNSFAVVPLFHLFSFQFNIIVIFTVKSLPFL